MVKQEMARVNIDILGINELKWSRMGEFNSEDDYIYYCGQESLRRNWVALIVNKRVWNVTLPASWETYMQVKKQQLQLDIEKWTGSKLGKEYVKEYIKVYTVTLLI